MSKKHFINLAAHLNAEYKALQPTARHEYGFRTAVDAIMRSCRESNPKFDVRLFLAAVYKD